MSEKMKKDKKTNGGFNMLNKIKKQIKNEKGLTLIELLAVIVIIAIIAAIAIPAIGNIITNSKYNAAKSDALNVLNSAQIYFMDNPEATVVGVTSAATGNTETLKEENYLEDAGHLQGDTAAAVTKTATGMTLTTGDITFSGNSKVKFDAATIEMINNDPQKGSKIGDSTYTIPQ